MSTTIITPRACSLRVVARRAAASRPAPVAARSPRAPVPARRDATSRRASTVAHAKKKGLFDEMLDVMEGGPKLRKWYGQDSSVGAPDAERPDPPPSSRPVPSAPNPAETEARLREADAKPRRATLVTDVDTMLGEAIVMQLIVAKQPVVALGISPEVAAARYGPYVTAADPSSAESEQAASLAVRLGGVRAVICAGATGALPAAAAADPKVKHVIVVGSSGDGGGLLGGLFGGEESRRMDPSRESAFADGDAAVTVVRLGRVKPGLGGAPVTFAQNGAATGGGGEMNLEDAAECVVRCLGAPPKPRGKLVFDAANGGTKRPWKELFAGLAQE